MNVLTLLTNAPLVLENVSSKRVETAMDMEFDFAMCHGPYLC